MSVRTCRFVWVAPSRQHMLPCYSSTKQFTTKVQHSIPLPSPTMDSTEAVPLALLARRAQLEEEALALMRDAEKKLQELDNLEKESEKLNEQIKREGAANRQKKRVRVLWEWYSFSLTFSVEVRPVSGGRKSPWWCKNVSVSTVAAGLCYL